MGEKPYLLNLEKPLSAPPIESILCKRNRRLNRNPLNLHLNFKNMIRDWENLPGHFLDSIVERLESPSDFFWFSLVCKSWYSIAKDNESKLSRIRTPMLLICANKKDTWNVYNIREKKLLGCQLKLPQRYCGSSKGWIVTMENNFRITLINPFQRLEGQRKKEDSIICLPPLPIRMPGYDFKCTLSADPVLNANDCVLLVAYGMKRYMSFIRVGKDATWTFIDDWCGIVDLAYFEGRFYALTQEYRFFSFEITSPCSTMLDMQLFDHNIGRNPCSKYLVISNEKELLMIYRIYRSNLEQITSGEYCGLCYKCVTTGFEIFEFNFDMREWKRKDTLDDTALFLGDTSAISVPVSSSSWCEPNCIYFCRDIGNTDFGGYNLKTESFFEPFTMEAKTLAENNSACQTVWVMPPSYRL